MSRIFQDFHNDYRLYPCSDCHILHLNPAFLALKAVLKVVGLACHNKCWNHPSCPLFCSSFSTGGFTLLFFEARDSSFSYNFSEKQGEETVKSDSAFVSDSQALLNWSCCNISFSSWPKLGSAFVRDWKSSHTLAPMKCEPRYLPSKVLSPALWFFLWLLRGKGRVQLHYSSAILASDLYKYHVPGAFPWLLFWFSL